MDFRFWILEGGLGCWGVIVLASEAEVPDAKTIWLFRQKLMKAGLIDELFERFAGLLDALGYQAQGGQIIDASIISVPIQRNGSRPRYCYLTSSRYTSEAVAFHR